MSQRYEIRLAGEGGQGMILAGIILAEAAAIYEGRNIVMTQAYAPQQRGGFTETELVLSDGEIDYPKVLSADLLLALTQEAFNRHSQQMARNGLILIDPSLVDATEVKDAHIARLPLREVALEAAGAATALNMVALGAISGLTGSVSLSALRAAQRNHFSGKSRLLNDAALRKGFELGKRLHRDRPAPSTSSKDSGPRFNLNSPLRG